MHYIIHELFEIVHPEKFLRMGPGGADVVEEGLYPLSTRRGMMTSGCIISGGFKLEGLVGH